MIGKLELLKKIFEFVARGEYLTLKNWELCENSSAFYNVLQQADGTWQAEVIFSFDQKSERGFSLPLNVRHDNPYRIFLVLQFMGYVFKNLSTNVYFVDNQKHLLQVLSLTKTLESQVAQPSEVPNDNEFGTEAPRPTHEGPLTLN